MAILQVQDLVKHFPVHGGFLGRVISKVHAVNGVSFFIEAGEILGVVGESGCGKSTLGKSVIRLLKPTSGSILYQGQELSTLDHQAMMPYRKKMQIVFQDPYSSLNPRMTVHAAIAEGVRFHGVVPDTEIDDYVQRLIVKVGLQADAGNKFPHEFSGGQRQRIGIARALALKPDFIVADEPVSALDVSIQAQILNLLMELKEEFNLTILFISHDLKVIEHFCDRVLVMYLGYVVEELPCHRLHEAALHPYTRALLGANPVNDPDDRRPLAVLEGSVPSPFDLPPGCPFASRCSERRDECTIRMPPLLSRGKQHRIACYAIDPITR